jgi:hypothetical protein
MTPRPKVSGRHPFEGIVGVLWMAWCAAMFYAMFWIAHKGFAVWVVPPLCGHACGEEHQEFDHVRVGSRGGPHSACVCRGGAEVRTSAPDFEVATGVILFLIGCYAPLAIAGIWDRRLR